MKICIALVAFVLTLSSCGFHIEKRLYRDGFYVSGSGHNRSEINSGPFDARSGENLCGDGIPLYDSSGSVTTAESVTEQQPVSRESMTGSAGSQTTFSFMNRENPVDDSTTSTSRKAQTTDEKMASIGKLAGTTKALLKCSLIVFPLAFVTLLATLIISVVLLSKIRKLQRSSVLDEEQKAQLKKHKRAGRLALILSIVFLLLIAAAGLILLSQSASMISPGPILSL